MSEARLIMGGAAPRQGRDVIGIIDPHRHHLADAAPKGLALAPARQRSPRPTRSTAPCGPYHRRGSYEPLDLDRSRALRTRSRPPLTGFRASLASSPMEMPTAPQGRRIRESVVCSPGTGFAELADHDELADWTRPASSSRSAIVRLVYVRPVIHPVSMVDCVAQSDRYRAPRWSRFVSSRPSLPVPARLGHASLVEATGPTQGGRCSLATAGLRGQSCTATPGIICGTRLWILKISRSVRTAVMPSTLRRELVRGVRCRVLARTGPRYRA
jgi:hypothetical protein